MSAPEVTVPGDRDPDVLRVMTYNTEDFHRDRHTAAAVVRALAPDVLCLQEVPRRLEPTAAAALFAAECELFLAGPLRGSGGTAVLTGPRVRVRRSGVGRLPVPLGVRRRGYAAVLGELPCARSASGSPPTFVAASLHLSLNPAQRLEHLDRVLTELDVDRSGRSRGHRFVLGGDTNDLPSGAAQRRLDSRLVRADDARQTFPVDAPDRAIDTIRVTPDTPVLATGGSDMPPDVLARASDHRPLWADLRLD